MLAWLLPDLGRPLGHRRAYTVPSAPVTNIASSVIVNVESNPPPGSLVCQTSWPESRSTASTWPPPLLPDQ